MRNLLIAIFLKLLYFWNFQISIFPEVWKLRKSGNLWKTANPNVGENTYLNLVDNYNDETLHAAMGNLMPMVIKAIQELAADVTALKAA